MGPEGTTASEPTTTPTQSISSPAKSNMIWIVTTAVLAVVAIALLVVGMMRVQTINDRRAAFSINSETLAQKFEDTTKYKVDSTPASPGTNAPATFSVSSLDSDGLTTARFSVVSYVLTDPGSFKKLSPKEATQKLVAYYYGNTTKDAVVSNVKAVKPLKINLDGQREISCFSLDVDRVSSTATRLACSVVKNAAALLIAATDSQKNDVTSAQTQFEKLVQPVLEVHYEN